ncbi:MAG: hypothetical protein PUP92_35200 [Rhizonema sp. PD38]|nr:hypothetical protein [Rhizonema sp. PD38]
MKIRKSLATITLCVLPAFGASVVLNTQQAKAEKVCSNRSLYGAYENAGEGYFNYTDPYSTTALNTFDGNGKVTGTVLARSIAGQITTNLSFQGTYQVNPDCSLTASYTRADGTTANYSGVVYDDGNKFGYTQTDPGTIVNIKGERVNRYRYH